MKHDRCPKPIFSPEVRGIRLRVFRVGKNPRLRGQTLPPRDPSLLGTIHSHFTYEIFFVTAGTLRLVTPEETRAFERTVLILPPGTEHYTVSTADESYCLLFAFDRSRGSAAHLQRLDRLEEKLRQLVTLRLDEDMVFYIRKIARLTEEGTAQAEEKAALLAALLFYQVLPQLLEEPEPRQAGQGNSRHMGAIEGYVNDHLQERITLAQVAAHVYLSPRQVSRILREQGGCTLGEMVTGKKLAAAELLLRDTRLKISEVAARVQLGSCSHFHQLFRTRYGVTPLQYRKNSRKTG